MSAVQVIAVAVTFVILYRYVLDTLGASAFGVWAVVLATTSASHIANLGLAAGAVKFVAQYLARDDREQVRVVIQTAIISVAAAVGIIVLALFPVLSWILGMVIEPETYVPEARSILPYALASFWLTSTGAVVQSSLDGIHRVYVRNLLIILASVAYLGLAFLLVPSHGLEGLALAQVIQAALLLFGAWIALVRLLPELPAVPLTWRAAAFREMLGYSLKFQVISFAQILFEPLAKALLSKFGSVATVSSFEFAHRMVVQLRALLTTAHQAVVPAISHLQERNPGLLRAVYTDSFRLLLFLVAASLPLLLALTPDISRIWIGSYDGTFVLYANLLLVGWFLNMLANPAYFANMGTGALKWNVYGQLLIAGVFLTLGLGLAGLVGPDGVVVAYVTALLVGSLTIAVAYQHAHRIRLQELVDRQTILLGGAGLLALAATHLLSPFLGPEASPLIRVPSIAGLYLVVVAIPLLHHSMRRELLEWVRKAFVAA